MERAGLEQLVNFDIPRFRLAYLGAGLAAVYAIGFAVVSIHTARFGTPSYDLFRARYAAAGALFAFHAAFPALTGVAFLRELAVLKKARRWWIPFLIAFFFGAFAWEGAFWLTTVGPHEHFPLDGVWFFLVAGLAVVTILFMRHQVVHNNKGPAIARRFHSRHLGRLVLVVVGAALALRIFATQLFPRLDPGLGGGAASAVVLSGNAEDDPILNGAFGSEVLLVDRSGVGIKVVVPDSLGGYVAFEIPNSTIRSIRFVAVRPLPPGPLFIRGAQ